MSMKATHQAGHLIKRLGALRAPASSVRAINARLSLRPGPDPPGSLARSEPVIRRYSNPSISRRTSVKPRQQAMVAPPILEVERKFAPTTLSMQLLAQNAGEPPFTSILHQGNTKFEDTYYDTAQDDLCHAGVWIRRRDAHWEAKVRVGGDYTNSAFEELTDVAHIAKLLGGLLPGATLSVGGGLQGGGVVEVARFASHRRKFLVDGRFTVVLDTTDFGHVVGEVELEKNVQTAEVEGDEGMAAAAAAGVGYDRAQVIADMDREIDHFMKSYAWAFPPGKPVGKLTAYFALKHGHRKPTLG